MKYRLLKDRFSHKAGQLVYAYHGYDYGLCRDDDMAFGVRHIAVSEEEDKTPFFTVPKSDLEEAEEQ